MTTSWKDLLEPHAQRYSRFLDDLAFRVGACSDEGLEELRAACEKPETTNCWWATYSVAGEVRKAANRELLKRKTARESLELER